MKTVNVELADRPAHEIEQLVRAGRFAAVALYSAVSNCRERHFAVANGSTSANVR
jgi:hypothetical protein